MRGRYSKGMSAPKQAEMRVGMVVDHAGYRQRLEKITQSRIPRIITPS